MAKNFGISNMINDNGNAAANQFIINEGNKIVFQSYNTRIACIQKDKVYIVPNAVEKRGETLESSVTTRKHLYIFLRNHCGMWINGISDLKAAIKSGTIILKKNI
ncbi:MAG: hypothetical protein VZR36_08895 [Prevotella sp.]|nr:hypothetical protein [Prevotella sp.]